MFVTGKPFQLKVMEQSNLLVRFVTYEENVVLSIRNQQINLRKDLGKNGEKTCFQVYHFFGRLCRLEGSQ